MEDEAGLDEKILAVPVDKLHPYYTDVGSWRDLPKILIDQIQHFFTHYKDLEVNTWVHVKRWGDAEEPVEFIRAGLRLAEAKAAKALDYFKSALPTHVGDYGRRTQPSLAPEYLLPLIT